MPSLSFYLCDQTGHPDLESSEHGRFPRLQINVCYLQQRDRQFEFTVYGGRIKQWQESAGRI